MTTPNVNDILASTLNKSATPVVIHENNPSESHSSEKNVNKVDNSNDATASSEATSIKSEPELVEEVKVQMNVHLNKNQFLAKVDQILKTKMDSADRANALRDIAALL